MNVDFIPSLVSTEVHERKELSTYLRGSAYALDYAWESLKTFYRRIEHYYHHGIFLGSDKAIVDYFCSQITKEQIEKTNLIQIEKIKKISLTLCGKDNSFLTHIKLQLLVNRLEDKIYKLVKQMPLNDDSIMSVVRYLSIKEISRLNSVCKHFNYLFNRICSNEVKVYKHARGVSRNLSEKGLSFNSLLLDCRTHVEKYFYTPELCSLFGGMEKIFDLRTVVLKHESNECSFKELDAFSQEQLFKELPPIFRLRINEGDGRFNEKIIIKYTFFVPREILYDKLTRDQVWHDYFILYTNEYVEGQWKISDMRSSDHWPYQFKKINPFPSDQLAREQPVIFYKTYMNSLISNGDNGVDLNSPRLKGLINGKPIGQYGDWFFNTQLIDLRNHLPSCLRDYYNREKYSKFDNRRMFKNFPVVLGHVDVNHFYEKVLKVEKLPDMIVDSNGNLKRNPDKRDTDAHELYTF